MSTPSADSTPSSPSVTPSRGKTLKSENGILHSLSTKLRVKSHPSRAPPSRPRVKRDPKDPWGQIAEYRRKPQSRRNPCLCCICLPLGERSSMIIGAGLNISTSVYITVHIGLSIVDSTLPLGVPKELGITALFCLTLVFLFGLLLILGVLIATCHPQMSKKLVKSWVLVTLVAFGILIAHFAFFRTNMKIDDPHKKSYVSAVSIWWILNGWALYLAKVFLIWVDIEVINPPPISPEISVQMVEAEGDAPNYSIINDSNEWSFETGDLFRRPASKPISDPPSENTLTTTNSNIQKRDLG